MQRDARNENFILHPATECRALRQASGWTQSELAWAADVSLGVVWRLEQAQSDGDLAKTWIGSIIQVAEALRVSPAELYPRLEELEVWA